VRSDAVDAAASMAQLLASVASIHWQRAAMWSRSGQHTRSPARHPRADAVFDAMYAALASPELRHTSSSAVPATEIFASTSRVADRSQTRPYACRESTDARRCL